jgi:hypothetical protein
MTPCSGTTARFKKHIYGNAVYQALEFGLNGLSFSRHARAAIAAKGRSLCKRVSARLGAATLP